MRAYKFLDARGVTVISGTPWPLPSGDVRSPWVEAASVRPCHEGIHACRVEELAYWVSDELWEIELDGEIRAAPHKIVARRGRLVRRLDAWSGGVSAELSRWCAWRTRDAVVGLLNDVGEPSWAEQFAEAPSLRDVARVARAAVPALGDGSVSGVAAGFAGDVAALAPTSHIAMGPFVAACAAAHSAVREEDDAEGHAEAFAAERRAQSDWIAGRLLLT